jgi:hypothetical protein
MQVVQKVYAKVRPDGLVRAVNSISSGALELPKSCAKIAPEVTDNGQH